jgi:mRNA-degrading endonuclease RelE of RelBE toxin-antitoxin system
LAARLNYFAQKLQEIDKVSRELEYGDLPPWSQSGGHVDHIIIQPPPNTDVEPFVYTHPWGRHPVSVNKCALPLKWPLARANDFWDLRVAKVATNMDVGAQQTKIDLYDLAIKFRYTNALTPYAQEEQRAKPFVWFPRAMFAQGVTTGIEGIYFGDMVEDMFVGTKKGVDNFVDYVTGGSSENVYVDRSFNINPNETDTDTETENTESDFKFDVMTQLRENHLRLQTMVYGELETFEGPCAQACEPACNGLCNYLEEVVGQLLNDDAFQNKYPEKSRTVLLNELLGNGQNIKDEPYEDPYVFKYRSGFGKNAACVVFAQIDYKCTDELKAAYDIIRKVPNDYFEYPVTKSLLKNWWSMFFAYRIGGLPKDFNDVNLDNDIQGRLLGGKANYLRNVRSGGYRPQYVHNDDLHKVIVTDINFKSELFTLDEYFDCNLKADSSKNKFDFNFKRAGEDYPNLKNGWTKDQHYEEHLWVHCHVLYKDDTRKKITSRSPETKGADVWVKLVRTRVTP